MQSIERSTPTARPRQKSVLQLLGPGLITGASDDDPSGIATYSQAGAQFGYALAWTLVLTYPLMCAVQEISARIGRVTGRGLAGNMRRHAPRWLMHGMITLLVAANVINLAADLSAMGAAIQLVIGGSQSLYIAGLAVASLATQVLVGYRRYASILKWLTLSLLAYAGTVIVVDLPWAEVARGLLIPRIELSGAYVTIAVAIFGTTISPYLFFWQAEDEVEEQQAEHQRPLREEPAAAAPELRRVRLDTYVGMALSNLVALFIMLTAAGTLHANGKTDIQSAAQAAEALRPIAGDLAFALFALGIVGTGLLAVPVLAGAAAYAIGEARQWPVGLGKPWRRAKEFYGTLTVIMLTSAALNALPVEPMKALVWSAVVNGILAPPLMATMLLLGRSRTVMGKLVLPGWLQFVGWLATAIMTVAAIALVFV
jgi:NRAMP (natural resistance-associated macrophage protein)-like metal ion transporter